MPTFVRERLSKIHTKANSTNPAIGLDTNNFSSVECILGCSVASLRWDFISPNWKDNRKGGFKDRSLKLRSRKIKRVNLKLIITLLISQSIVYLRQISVRDLLRGANEKKEESATNNCCYGLI